MNDRDDIYALIGARADYIRPNSGLSDYILKMVDFSDFDKGLNSHCLTDKCTVFPSRHPLSELRLDLDMVTPDLQFYSIVCRTLASDQKR